MSPHVVELLTKAVLTAALLACLASGRLDVDPAPLLALVMGYWLREGERGAARSAVRATSPRE